MSTKAVLAHSVAGPPGTVLADWLERGPHFHGSFHALVGPFPSIIARVSGPARLLEEATSGLPEGAARAEAIAVRLRRAGVELRPGDPDVCDAAGLQRLCRMRGHSSLEIARADPSLVPEMQIGSWFEAAWRARTLRRLVRPLLARPGAARLLGGRPLGLRAAADACFWQGAREAARPREWRRLTASSYVALCYHRIAGEGKPGQERLDLPPEAFDAQMRLLRRLRFRPLTAGELLEFHRDPGSVLPRRSYVVTADDGYRDCAVALQRHARHLPQLYVPTAAVGATAWWVDHEPIAHWDELTALAEAGVSIGAHSRTHASLPGLPDESLEDEVGGALRDLQAQLPRPLPVLAYPHGRHDQAVRAAAIRAGYDAAYTTEVGRNGAGTDPWCLRRVGIKAHDSLPAFLWKVVTGEPLPARWEQRRLRSSEEA